MTGRPPALRDPVATTFTFVLGVELGAMLGFWRTITSRNNENPLVGLSVMGLLGGHFLHERRRATRSARRA